MKKNNPGIKISKRFCRVICCILVIVTACSASVFADTKCYAKGTYCKEKAVAYAKDISEHINVADEGLCAYYVCRCLQAGGLSFPDGIVSIKRDGFKYYGFVGDLYKALVKPSSGHEAYATCKACTKTTMKSIQPGDMIMITNGKTGSKTFYYHIMFVTGVNKAKDDDDSDFFANSTVTISQNNTFRHLTSYSFQKVINCSFGMSDWKKTYIIHINDSHRCTHTDYYDELGTCSSCGYVYNYASTRVNDTGVIYSNGQALILRSTPYASSKNILKTSKGKNVSEDEIRIAATVKNAFGQSWKEVVLSTGQTAYISIDNTDASKNEPYIEKSINVSDIGHPKTYYENYPNKNNPDKKTDTTVTVKGKIQSAYPIKKITGEIFSITDNDGKRQESLITLGGYVQHFEASNINKNSIKNIGSLKGNLGSDGKIKKNVTMNSAMSFSKLAGKDGSYLYRITIEADPGEDASQAFKDSCKLVLEYPFIINSSFKELSANKADYTYIIYNDNDGTGHKRIDMLQWGKAATVPELQKDGYRFLGWAESPDGEVVWKAGESKKPTVKANNYVYLSYQLYAIWEMIPAEASTTNTKSFDANVEGGSIDVILDYGLPGILTNKTLHCIYNDTIDLFDPQNESTLGYKFLGWTIQSYETEKYFNANTRLWVGSLFKSLCYLKDVHVDNRGTIYVIALNENFLKCDEKEASKMKLSFVCKANWEKQDVCKIVYDGNGDGVVDLPKDTLAVKGDEATVSVGPSQKGFLFTGWNTKKDGTGTSYKPQSSIKLKKDITLYAQWEVEKLTAEQAIAQCQATPTNLKMHTIKECPVYNVPGVSSTYASSKKLYTIPLGTDIVASQILTNSAGHNWYKVSYASGKEGYVYYTDVEIDGINGSVKIDKVWNPGTVVGGNSKDLEGKISVVGNNIYINRIYAFVQDGDNNIFDAAETFSNGKKTSYNLASRDKKSINMNIPFAKFKSGACLYSVLVDICTPYITDKNTIDYYIENSLEPFKAQTFNVMGPYNFYFEYSDGTSITKSAAYKKTLTIKEKNDQKDNSVFLGWQLIKNYEEVYTADHGWQTLENAEAKGYALVLYGKGSKITVDSNLVGKTGEETFTFVPVFSEIPIEPVIDDPQNNGEPVLSDLITIKNLQIFDVDNDFLVYLKGSWGMGLDFRNEKGIMGLISCDPSINDQNYWMSVQFTLVDKSMGIGIDPRASWVDSGVFFAVPLSDVPSGLYDMEFHFISFDGTKDLYQTVPVRIGADGITIPEDYEPMDASYDSENTATLFIGDPGNYLKINEIDNFHYGVTVNRDDEYFYDIFNRRGVICSLDSNKMELCSNESEMVGIHICDPSGNYCSDKFTSIVEKNRLYLGADQSCPAGEYTINMVFGNESDGYITGSSKFIIYNDSDYQDIPFFEISDCSNFSGKTIVHENKDEGWCVEVNNRGVYGHLNPMNGGSLSDCSIMRLLLIDSNGKEVDFQKKFGGEYISIYQDAQAGIFAIDVPKKFPSGQYTLVIGLADSNGIYCFRSISVAL